MYCLEFALEDEEGTIADELKPGDLAVVLAPSHKNHIVLKVVGYLVDLTNPDALPWAGYCSLKVRKLSPGESITLTV